MFLRRLRKILVALVIFAVGSLALILGLLRLEHGFSVTLPNPTGPFAVGRTMYHWIDSARTDPLAPVPNQKRELIVWVWYPAASSSSSINAPYQPAPWRAANEHKQSVLMNKFFTRDVSLVSAHSVADADVSPAETTYPVVIMKSGMGALATDYTTLAEDLASHGYIVVGSDAPYSAFVVVFPDGRVETRTPAGNPSDDLPLTERTRIANQVIPVWSADTTFEVNQLATLNATDPSGKFRGRLNLQALGVFGHSFGGATAAQFCHEDRRCKAGINLDGAPFGTVIQEGIKQPFTFFLSDHGNTSDPESSQILGDIESLCKKSKGNCQRIALRGSGHFNFSDQSLLKDRFLTRLVGAIGPVGERRGLAITSAYLSAFFDVHLKGAAADRLKKIEAQYPEISLSL